MILRIHCLLTTLLLCVPVLAQNVVTFDDQGWSSDQSLDSNFTVGNFLYSSNKNFYTNYGCNFDVYNIGIFYVFQNPAVDQITITKLDNKSFNLLRMAAYQVSELSTDDLIIEGWNGSSKEYSDTFSNITTWQIIDLNYDNIDKVVIKLEPSGSGGLTDFNFDDFLFADPFPVELTSFIAKVKDNQVLLKWITETEINNYGFEIERKLNNDWEKIGFVEGHGNSNSPKEYSFIDNSLIGGSKFQYRLKQIDNDGKFEYSDEIEVVLLPTIFELAQNYPNPFNPNTIIKYSIPEYGFVTLDVYNLLGEKVASLVNSAHEAGRYEIGFDASELASGIYVYNLKSGSFNSSKKMLLMK